MTRTDDRNMISVDFGKGERGEQLIIELRKIAKSLGFTWGGEKDDPNGSIGKMIKSIAAGESKVCPQP